MINLPLKLPYEGATSIDDDRGWIVAECPDAETAAAIVRRVNGQGLSWSARRIARRHYTAKRLLALRVEAARLRRERDEALDELLAIRGLLASAMAEHQGQGLADLIRGLLLETERRADEFVMCIRTMAQMGDAIEQLTRRVAAAAAAAAELGPIRRVAAPE